MKRAYMDHAAATPVRPEVMEAMLPFFVERFGNPSAVYDLGSAIKAVMEEQRGKVARLIGARPDEIIFTSSGAEANNLAIKGMALATFLKRGQTPDCFGHRASLGAQFGQVPGEVFRF